jgi:hypothetical protein
MWTRCRHRSSRDGGRCGRCLQQHGYCVSASSWHSISELKEAADHCRMASEELLASSMARDELVVDCEVKLLEAVGALHVWLKLLSPPHPEAYMRAQVRLGGQDTGLYLLGLGAMGRGCPSDCPRAANCFSPRVDGRFAKVPGSHHSRREQLCI